MYINNFLVLYVCLFFNLVDCEQYSNFFTLDDDGDQISEKCILKIIRNNIQCGNLITVVTEQNVDSLLEAISNEECYSVIARTFHSREWLVRNEYIVVLAKDIFEFENGIMDLSNDLLWNTKAKYIIEIPKIRRGQEITKVLLKHNIFSAVFVDNSRKSAKRIYTYSPFKYGNCAGHYDTVLSLGLCNDNESVLNIFPTFSDKFNNCIIRVVKCEDLPHVILESSNYRLRGNRLPGLEEYILESIGANKGYLIDYILTDYHNNYGVVLTNGTVTGLLKYLAADEADISIGGYTLILNRAKAFDYIWGHFYGNLDIFTPAKPVNRWKLVYEEFSWLTWILIGVFYCLFIVVLNVYNITASFWNDRVLLLLRLWGYFYGNTSNSLYKKNKIRGILVCWMWFTFFVSNFYNTAFYSLTTVQNSYVHHIVNEKFDVSIYKPCISNTIRTLFKYTFNITWPRNALTMCDERKISLETVAGRDDLFSVEFFHTYTMNEQKYIDEKGNRMLDARTFSRATAVNVMFTTRGFPLKDMIQTAARNMAETGLLQAHLQEIYLRTLKAVHAKQKAFKNLDMRSLRVAFLLLLSGLVIASIAFVLEIVSKKSNLILMVWKNYNRQT